MGNFFSDMFKSLPGMGGGGSNPLSSLLGGSSGGAGDMAAAAGGGALLGSAAASGQQGQGQQKPPVVDVAKNYGFDPNGQDQQDTQFNQMRKAQMGMGGQPS